MERPVPADAASLRERWVGQRVRGWSSASARLVTGLLLFLTVSGLAVTFLPFSAFVQHSVLVHTVLGIALVPLLAGYLAGHLRAYWSFPLSHVKFTGWVAAAMTLVCVGSGVVLTAQGLFGTRITYAWRLTHLVSTFGLLLFAVPHLGALLVRELRRRGDPLAVPAAGLRGHAGLVAAVLALGLGATAVLTAAVRPPRFENAFPTDYDRATYEGAGPFAPSLATTTSGRRLRPAPPRAPSPAARPGATSRSTRVAARAPTASRRWTRVPAIQA